MVVDPELELRLADHVRLDEDVAQPVLLVVPVQHRLQISRGKGPLLHEKLPDRGAVRARLLRTESPGQLPLRDQSLPEQELAQQTGSRR